MLLASLASFGALRKSRFEGLVFVAISVSLAAMMMASSYVEEEQQFWYWAVKAWLCILYIKEYDPYFQSY